MQKKRGISLIVLSITILVMAILAATAIIALDDSGIIGRSKSTVNKQNYTQEYERLQVIKNGILTDNLGKITVDEFVTELTNKDLIETDITTNADGSTNVTTKTGFDVNIIQDEETNLIISLSSSATILALDKTTITTEIESGTTTTDTLTLTIENGIGSVIWSSSDESLVTVYSNGDTATITILAAGTANISARIGNITTSCTVVATETEASS